MLAINAMGNIELAETLFGALAKGDADQVRQVCAPDMRANQNHGPNMNVDALINFTVAVHKVAKDFRYEDAVRSATSTGFVEEHNVRGTLPDGTEFDLAVCVVAKVQEGVITELREYADSFAASGLFKALSRA